MTRPAVTALHGFSQRGDSWAELEELVGGTRQWLTPEVTATTLLAATMDLIALWERDGAAGIDLIGYSQGGRLALYAASLHPQRLRTLTVISAHAGFEGEARSARLRADRELADRIERGGIEWFAAHWAAHPIFAGLARRRPDLQSWLDASRRANEPGLLAQQLRGMGGAATAPFWERLTSIEVPTLVIAGAEDAAYTAHARRLAEILPHARVEIVPDAGHVVHLEQPRRVAALLGDHLSTR